MTASDFAYTSARLRALEPKLLSLTEVERMLGAKDVHEAYKILNDLDYSTHVGDIEKVENFQEVIHAGLYDTKLLLDRIVPDSRVLDILFLQFDFHNIKTILKGLSAEKGEEEIRQQLLNLGRIPLGVLEAFFYQKNQSTLPLPDYYTNHIKEAVKRAKLFFEKTKNPKIIDLIIDRKLYELTLIIAQKTRNSFTINFVQHEIDIANIKGFLRMKLLNQDKYFIENDLLEEWFIPGGFIKFSQFKSGLSLESDALSNLFKATPYGDAIAKGIEAYEKSDSFLYLEKQLEDFLMNYARTSRYIPFGPESVIAYFYAKQGDARIIRMIMVGKLRGVSNDLLRERLHKLFT